MNTINAIKTAFAKTGSASEKEIQTPKPSPAKTSAFSMSDYKKNHRLGVGSYGTVYEYEHRITGDLTAVKKIDAKNTQVVIREIMFLKENHHPNIANIIGVDFVSDDVCCIMLEHGGISLRNYMDAVADIPLSIVKGFMRELCEAVSFVNERGYLHRDIKPDNIMIKDGHVKLIDFGLSRTYSYPVRKMSNAVCTMWYKAPELILGEEKYTTAIEVWSVACVFFSMLTKGKILFPGDSHIDMLFKIFAFSGTPNKAEWPEIEELVNWQNIMPKFKGDKGPLGLLGDISEEAVNAGAVDILCSMLELFPGNRATFKTVLSHSFLAPPSSSSPSVDDLTHLMTKNLSLIPCESFNEFGESEAQVDLYYYLKSRSYSKVVNSKIRIKAIDVMIHSHHELKMARETLFLGINILDKFMAVLVRRGDDVRDAAYLDYGTTALSIAYLIEEYGNEATTLHLVSLIGSRELATKLIKYMLTTIDFKCTHGSQIVFWRRLSVADNSDMQTRVLASYIMETSMANSIVANEPPAKQAAIAYKVAFDMLNKEWSRSLIECSGYTRDQLFDGCLSTVIFLKDIMKLLYSFEKYKTTPYLRASVFANLKIGDVANAYERKRLNALRNICNFE